MSQKDVAEAIGNHAMTISKYERGVQDPNTMTLAALAKALGVSTDWLLTEHEDFIHHGFKGHENVMRVALSLPNLSLRVREDTLSDEAIKALGDYVEYILWREKRRRDEEDTE